MDKDNYYFLKHIKYDKLFIDDQAKLDMIFNVEKWCKHHCLSKRIVRDMCQFILGTIPLNDNSETEREKIFSTIILFVWFAYFDDYMENTSVDKCLEWSEMFSSLESDTETNLKDACDVWHKSFADIWNRWKACTQPRHYIALATVMKNWCKTCIDEHNWKNEVDDFNMDQFFEHKKVAFNGDIGLVILDMALDINIMRDDRLLRARDIYRTITSMINDLYSYDKDFLQNDAKFNYLAVYSKHNNCSLSVTVSSIKKLLESCERELCLLEINYPDIKHMNRLIGELVMFHQVSERYA